MMSEQPGQTRPTPPDHDPIIHLDFPIPCDIPNPAGGPCINPAAWIGTIHNCADKRNGRHSVFCQTYLEAVKAVTDYPQRCACGHAMCSFIDFISELEPLTPRSRP